MSQTENWQNEGITNTWAPHLGHRARKIRCLVGKPPPNTTWAVWPQKKHLLDLRSTSQADAGHEPETRQAPKNTETTVHHSPCSFQCFRKGCHKTNQLLSTRISIFSKSHRWLGKLLKCKFLPLSPSFFFFSLNVKLQALSDFIDILSEDTYYWLLKATATSFRESFYSL